MAKHFTCNRPIKHDGKRYETGDPIQLEKPAAEPLLARGAIAEPKPAKKAAGAKDDPGGEPRAGDQSGPGEPSGGAQA